VYSDHVVLISLRGERPGPVHALLKGIIHLANLPPIQKLTSDEQVSRFPRTRQRVVSIPISNTPLAILLAKLWALRNTINPNLFKMRLTPIMGGLVTFPLRTPS
jgi:hypothetical protein